LTRWRLYWVRGDSHLLWEEVCDIELGERKVCTIAERTVWCGYTWP